MNTCSHPTIVVGADLADARRVAAAAGIANANPTSARSADGVRGGIARAVLLTPAAAGLPHAVLERVLEVVMPTTVGHACA